MWDSDCLQASMPFDRERYGSLAGANIPRLTGGGYTTLELFGSATNMFASD